VKGVFREDQARVVKRGSGVVSGVFGGSGCILSERNNSGCAGKWTSVSPYELAARVEDDGAR
jgi:hypothetical protein